jgi:GxxExxY protein
MILLMKEDGDRLSYEVIGLAMGCHRELGPGLHEMFYHALLDEKLIAAGIAYSFKPRGQLIHRGIIADEFEADLLVSNELVLELKMLWGNFTPEHLLQLICYLKFWRLPTGLLFDFGKESLICRRIAFTPPTVSFNANQWVESAPPFITHRSQLHALALAIEKVLTEHGLGYRGTTYRGLMFIELTANGLEVIREPTASIRSTRGVVLGEAQLHCLVVTGSYALLISALRDAHQAADRAVLQTYLKHLGLRWGVTANFGKHRLDTQFVRGPKPAT